MTIKDIDGRNERNSSILLVIIRLLLEETMRLVRYHEPTKNSPALFNNWMDDLFSEFFDNSFKGISKHPGYPLVDIDENDTEYLFTVELPGVPKENVNIEIDNRLLTISGEKNVKKEESKSNCFRKETFSGTFTRSFTLPDHVETDQAKANYQDGVLELTIPKSTEKAKKKIEIK